jgi:hypothetical integral membrane protein (TIGR02206 family)
LQDFSGQHIVALAVILSGAAASIHVARSHPGPRIVILGRVLAVVILGGWIAEYIADVVLGLWSVEYDLPLQLTDLVTVVSALALWTRRPGLVELTYFWALTATLQAVVTPDLAYSFPSVFYFTYFTYHGGAILAACLLVFGCRLYPRPGAVRRVYAASLVWTAVAGAGDVITGGNYMYLRDKPAHGTLLDVMGPWPWYIASTAVLGLGLLYLAGGLAAAARRSARLAEPIRQPV